MPKRGLDCLPKQGQPIKSQSSKPLFFKDNFILNFQITNKTVLDLFTLYLYPCILPFKHQGGAANSQTRDCPILIQHVPRGFVPAPLAKYLQTYLR